MSTIWKPLPLYSSCLITSKTFITTLLLIFCFLLYLTAIPGHGPVQTESFTQFDLIFVRTVPSDD